jgi:hypothetical protein
MNNLKTDDDAIRAL